MSETHPADLTLIEAAAEMARGALSAGEQPAFARPHSPFDILHLEP